MSKIPEKWFVRVTPENLEYLKKYINSRPDLDPIYKNDVKGCVLSHRGDGSYIHWGDFPPDIYTEITIKDFLEHFLEKEEEKKHSYKYKVGDTVEIIRSGSGYSGCEGEQVEILKLGTYFSGPGYRTTIPRRGSSNVKNDEHNGMAGENSFKLVKSVTRSESFYIVGKVYRVDKTDSDTYLLCRFERMFDPERMEGYYISNMNGSWEFAHSTPYIAKDRKVSDATEEESKWLEKCIKLNKFIEKPEKEKKMKINFERGDYIVTLTDSGNCGRKNYCSKQREQNTYLKPEIDVVGDTNNGNSEYECRDTSETLWRYATKEEIEEYNKRGKPYDVTELLKSSKKEKELEVGDSIKLGELTYKVASNFFLSSRDNSSIFRELGISDKYAYVRSIVGYDTSGDFPELRNIEDLNKVVKALQKMLDSKRLSEEQKLIEECRGKYPIGTRFYPAHVIGKHEYCIITNDKFRVEGDYIYALTDEEKTRCSEKRYGGTILNRVVKEGSQWAEILPEEKEEVKYSNKIEDLTYPDVIHILDSSQYKKVTQYQKLSSYDPKYSYYLVGAHGNSDTPYEGRTSLKERPKYRNIEFDDIIFPSKKGKDISHLNLRACIDKRDISPYFDSQEEIDEALKILSEDISLCGGNFFNNLKCTNVSCSACPFFRENSTILKKLLPKYSGKTSEFERNPYNVGDYIIGKKDTLPLKVKYVEKVDSDYVYYDKGNRQKIERIRLATEEEIEEFLKNSLGCPFKHGDEVYVEIESQGKGKGKICIQKSGDETIVAVCQDFADGYSVKDTLGHKYSWIIVDTKESDYSTWEKGIRYHDINKIYSFEEYRNSGTSVEKLKEKPENLKKYAIGQEVIYSGEICKVAGLIYSRNYYIVQYSKGWKGSRCTYKLNEGELVKDEHYHYARLEELSPLKKVSKTAKEEIRVPDAVVKPILIKVPKI